MEEYEIREFLYNNFPDFYLDYIGSYGCGNDLRGRLFTSKIGYNILLRHKKHGYGKRYEFIDLEDLLKNKEFVSRMRDQKINEILE